MAQALKSNLQPYINDTLMHCLETSTAWLYIARSAFIDGFFANSVKPHWCITGPVASLIRVSVSQTSHNVRLDPSCGLCTYICHLLRGQHTICALMVRRTRLRLDHPPPPPILSPSHPPTVYTRHT